MSAILLAQLWSEPLLGSLVCTDSLSFLLPPHSNKPTFLSLCRFGSRGTPPGAQDGLCIIVDIAALLNDLLAVRGSQITRNHQL